MPMQKPNGGGGRGAGGSTPRATGRVPSRPSKPPVRLTKRGKGVAGTAGAAAAVVVGKKAKDYYTARDKNMWDSYNKLAAGYKGSAAQRSGMTENDYVQAKLKAQKDAAKGKMNKVPLKKKR